MAGRMWLANANYGAWVPCPSIEMPSGTQKWGVSGQFLNGGAYVRRSLTGARAFEMNWPMKHQSDLDTVEAFFEGAYGPGPFYVAEPGSMNYNMMPSYLATPGMAADDAPSLLYDKRPTVAQLTGASGEVLRGAQYAVTTGDLTNTFTLAIPADYTMFTYVVSSVANGVMISINGAPSQDAFGANSWDGGPQGSLLRISMNTSENKTVTLYMMVAIVMPSNSGYTVGDLVNHANSFPYPKGKGSAGMEVDGDFERTSYSAALDRYHGSVRLVEVEPWL